MGLGNNRDYTTTDRRIRRNLARHAALMAALIKQGMTREDASREALHRMMPQESGPTR
jgi:hypothetical protein